MKIFDFLKRKKSPEKIQIEEIQVEKIIEEIQVEKIPNPQPEKQKKDYLFYCHNCSKSFEINPSKIYPAKVRALYQDYFFTGKGYICPYCHKENIIG